MAYENILYAKNDHIATCSDGNRYRIYVNPQGRVVAEKQNKP